MAHTGAHDLFEISRAADRALMACSHCAYTKVVKVAVQPL